MPTVFSSSGACPNRRPTHERPEPHLCRNALGTAICASNGIGPGRRTFPRHRLQHCVVCSRWWKATAVSTHLTIWTEMPDWIIRMLWHSIWESAENHPTKERGNHE